MLVRLMVKLIDNMALFLAFVAGIAVLLMMLQITSDVVLRSVFNWPIPATLTLVSNYYMPLITFLPLAMVERLEQHISADVLTNFLPAWGQKHLFGWIFLLCFVVCALLTCATWVEAVDKFEIGAFAIERGTRIITWPVRFAAPISYGFLAFIFLVKFIVYLVGFGSLPSANDSLEIQTETESQQK